MGPLGSCNVRPSGLEELSGIAAALVGKFSTWFKAEAVVDVDPLGMAMWDVANGAVEVLAGCNPLELALLSSGSLCNGRTVQPGGNIMPGGKLE